MNNSEKQCTVSERQDSDRERLLEHLGKVPIVQVACERAHVSRATYYRWRKESENFSKAADKAISEGEAFITDMSESQVISMIKDKHWPAISFWLKYHHPKYGARAEPVVGAPDSLTPEQKVIIRKALRIAARNTSQPDPPVYYEDESTAR